MPPGELISTYEAAATLVVGTDAFRNERKATSSRRRSVEGVSIVGANAINECTVDIHIEDYFVGRFRNTLNGAVQHRMPDDYQAVRPALCPAGSKITATIIVAPTVSPLLIKLFGRG